MLLRMLGRGSAPKGADLSFGHGVQVTFDFWTVARSVLIFLGAPLVAGIVTRYTLIYFFGGYRQGYNFQGLRLGLYGAGAAPCSAGRARPRTAFLWQVRRCAGKASCGQGLVRAGLVRAKPRAGKASSGQGLVRARNRAGKASSGQSLVRARPRAGKESCGQGIVRARPRAGKASCGCWL
jgi:hypothetical protein